MKTVFSEVLVRAANAGGGRLEDGLDGWRAAGERCQKHRLIITPGTCITKQLIERTLLTHKVHGSIWMAIPMNEVEVMLRDIGGSGVEGERRRSSTYISPHRYTRRWQGKPAAPETEPVLILIIGTGDWVRRYLRNEIFPSGWLTFDVVESETFSTPGRPWLPTHRYAERLSPHPAPDAGPEPLKS